MYYKAPKGAVPLWDPLWVMCVLKLLENKSSLARRIAQRYCWRQWWCHCYDSWCMCGCVGLFLLAIITSNAHTAAVLCPWDCWCAKSFKDPSYMCSRQRSGLAYTRLMLFRCVYFPPHCNWSSRSHSNSHPTAIALSLFAPLRRGRYQESSVASFKIHHRFFDAVTHFV